MALNQIHKQLINTTNDTPKHKNLGKVGEVYDYNEVGKRENEGLEGEIFSWSCGCNSRKEEQWRRLNPCRIVILIGGFFSPFFGRFSEGEFYRITRQYKFKETTLRKTSTERQNHRMLCSLSQLKATFLPTFFHTVRDSLQKFQIHRYKPNFFTALEVFSPQDKIN